MNKLVKILFALAMGVATVWSFHIPPDLHFQQPQLARIFVWHFPCPIIASVLLFFGLYFAIRYFRTGDRHWDERAASIQEVSYLFCLLTMATGILFSEEQWGTWWQWDPRQTSFLIVLLIYLAYFILRVAFHDADRRAANSSAYLLGAFIPAMFLIFVYPSLPQVQSTSFHPTGSVLGGQIKGEYAIVVTLNMVLMSCLAVWLYRLRIAVGLQEIELDSTDERLAVHSGNSTPTGVVRRVSLPPES